MSFIGATGLDEHQENYDALNDKIDANASYINTLVGIPDPTHLPFFGINILNPGLYGLVERAEVNIRQLQTQGTGQGTTISGIETTISGIETEVAGIQTEVAAIQTEITAIQGEITGIESAITAIQLVELPAIGVSIGLVSGVANDAKSKAEKALGIWDESGDNVYHKKAGNVGIGTTFGSTLTNKLEVNGNINIPTGSTFRINDEPFSYSDLAGTPPVSSKWTNATDVDTNIYYNSGNVGIGVTTAINNKLEIGGNLNIPTGSKYKINNVNLAFSDLGGTLSYNSLTNQLTGGTNIQILNGVINNTYSLPTATTAVIGGVRPDGSTITITNGVISSTGGTAQVNSDWTQTNTSLKSFIQNKPTIVNSRWSKTGNEIFYNDGNVGIGTTDPFRSLHIHKLGISDEVGIILSDASSTTTAGGNRGFHLIKASDNNGYLWNYENKDLLFATNAIERMRILANGSVGIGTATNTSGVLLDVNGTIESRTGIGANSIFYFRGVANSDINRVISAGQYSTNSAVNDMVIRSTNKLVLQSGIGAPAIVIDTANKVGIGTTAPNYTLHLHKTATAQDVRIQLTDGTTTSGSARGLHIIKGSDNMAYFYNWENKDIIFGANAVEKFRITPNGLRFQQDTWHATLSGNERFYFGNNATTYIKGFADTPIIFRNGADQSIASIGSAGNLSVNNYLLANSRVYSRGGGYDIWIYSDSGGMSLNMGDQSTETAPSYFKLAAYSGHTFYESSQNRNHRFIIYSGVLTGTSREWRFNEFGNAFNALNSTAWTIASDQRIKKDIIKADLKTCYDNVKNINLYRFKYIDAFDNEYRDKNRLGYIAQEVKRHFPKATTREKRRLNDKREIPDLLNIDTEQINLTLYGAVKQLIKIVEKQNKRIKTLETLLNIDDNDDVENDAGEAYERIHDEEEIDIDTIEPTEPEQDRAPEPTENTEPSVEV